MDSKRKPAWLSPPVSTTRFLGQTRRLLADEHLPTVCDSARCPNRENCYSASTATFLILGPHCTRNCRFCSVTKNQPLPVDPDEPLRIARAVKQLGLSYVVITSTTRDDLPDGGAGQFAKTIFQIKQLNPGCLVEVLIPDLAGSHEQRNKVYQNLDEIIAAGPVVVGHNLETVPSLYPVVRSGADYGLSLEILRWTKKKYPNILTKSSLMLGLGEKQAEILSALQDLKKIHCDIIVLGQYLQPTREQMSVEEYVEPERFDFYRQFGLAMGIPAVLAGPLLRSSYRAAEVYQQFEIKKRS